MVSVALMRSRVLTLPSTRTRRRVCPSPAAPSSYLASARMLRAMSDPHVSIFVCESWIPVTQSTLLHTVLPVLTALTVVALNATHARP